MTLRLFRERNILQFNCPDGYPDVPDYKDWVLVYLQGIEMKVGF